MDFNVMTRREHCQAKVRVADRTFTTYASRGGVVYVLSGAWQLGENCSRPTRAPVGKRGRTPFVCWKRKAPAVQRNYLDAGSLREMISYAPVSRGLQRIL